jgi:hypothetical protein
MTEEERVEKWSQGIPEMDPHGHALRKCIYHL